jgi:hypothetical protein
VCAGHYRRGRFQAVPVLIRTSCKPVSAQTRRRTAAQPSAGCRRAASRSAIRSSCALPCSCIHGCRCSSIVSACRLVRLVHGLLVAAVGGVAPAGLGRPPVPFQLHDVGGEVEGHAHQFARAGNNESRRSPEGERRLPFCALWANPGASGALNRVIEALKLHKELQDAEREAAKVWADPGLVFTSTVGTALEPRNVNRAWNEVCDRAAIGRRRLGHGRSSRAFYGRELDASRPALDVRRPRPCQSC